MNTAMIVTSASPTVPTHSGSPYTISAQIVYVASVRAKKPARTQKTLMLARMALADLSVRDVVRRGVGRILRRPDAERDAGLRVVQVVRRGLRADPRDGRGAVPRRRAGGSPIQTPREAPRAIERRLPTKQR